MLSLDYYGLSLIFVTILTGVSCQQLTAVKEEESSLEDSTVTLSYNYSKQADGSDNFFWYRQYPGKPPEFLYYISGLNQTRPAESLKSDTKFSTKLTEEKKRVDLEIQKLQLSDSAVYYCALQPLNDGNQNKIFFGRGTRLTVEPKDVSEPSYYILEDGDPQVCLASDFSKHDANKNNTLFKGTEPVLMDNLYSQVAFLSGETSQCGEDGGSGQCEDKLEQDPMVNLMSMTVLGLRLLFLKTLVFNALMTFRLWVSQ